MVSVCCVRAWGVGIWDWVCVFWALACLEGWVCLALCLACTATKMAKSVKTTKKIPTLLKHTNMQPKPTTDMQQHTCTLTSHLNGDKYPTSDNLWRQNVPVTRTKIVNQSKTKKKLLQVKKTPGQASKPRYTHPTTCVHDYLPITYGYISLSGQFGAAKPCLSQAQK